MTSVAVTPGGGLGRIYRATGSTATTWTVDGFLKINGVGADFDTFFRLGSGAGTGTRRHVLLQVDTSTGELLFFAGGNGAQADETLVVAADVTTLYGKWIYFAATCGGTNAVEVYYRVVNDQASLTHATLDPVSLSIQAEQESLFTGGAAGAFGSDVESATNAQIRQYDLIIGTQLSAATLLERSETLAKGLPSYETSLALNNHTTAGVNLGTGADLTVTGTLSTAGDEPELGVPRGGSVQFVTAGASQQLISRTTNVPQSTGCTVCFQLQISSYGDWVDPFTSESASTYFGFEADAAGNFYFHRRNGFPTYNALAIWGDGYTGWAFIAVVSDGTNFTVYVQREGGNWTTIGTLAITVALGTLTTVSFGTIASFSPDTAGTCRGRELRAWSTQLTASQLQAERASANPIVMTGLLTSNHLKTAASAIDDTSPVNEDWSLTGAPTTSGSAPTALHVPPAPILLYKFNEASSGTAPTDILDSTADPLNLPISYGGGTGWTSDVGGNALLLGSSTPATGATANPGAKVIALDGAQVSTIEHVQNLLAFTSNGVNGVFCETLAIYDDGGEFFDSVSVGSVSGNTLAQNLAYRTAANGDISSPNFSISLGYQVHQWVLDTTLGAQRLKFFLNGFLSNSDNSVTQDTSLAFSGTGSKYVETFGSTRNSMTRSVGQAALYGSALTPADCLAHALRLFASSDNDPNVAGANLYAASTNGGTNDVSSSTSDHSISFTITIGAIGLNRKVLISIAYMGVTSGVTSVTFNGSGTGVHLSAQQQQTFATLAGCDVYEILDADLPAAGTYTIAVTVDGASGVACGSPVYLEGVTQSYATNVGLATGTGTSITATLGSSATAGSILTGQLLDVSFGDAAVSGSNQLRLVAQATSSVIEQVVDSKYVPSSGSNSMSWSGLTNTTGKIAVVVEAQVFGAATVSPMINGISPARFLCLQNTYVPIFARSRAVPAYVPVVAAVSPPMINGLLALRPLYFQDSGVPVLVGSQIVPGYMTSGPAPTFIDVLLPGKTGVFLD